MTKTLNEWPDMQLKKVKRKGTIPIMLLDVVLEEVAILRLFSFS